MSSRPDDVRFRIDGKEYRWSGWLGCQLESWEWRRLRAGTQRDLMIGSGEIIRMNVYTTEERKHFKVRTTWAVSNRGTHEEHQARILDLKRRLAALV